MAPIKDERFLHEIWALYGVSVFWAMLRFPVKIRTTGIRGLQIDDGFAFFTVICWTVIIAGIQITYYTGTNVDYSEAEVWDLTGNQIERVSFGTKLYVITVYMYISMVFSLKAIVIILYQRLAFGKWQKRLLDLTIVLCVVGFLSTTLMFSLVCLPFERRFRVRPLPKDECRASSTFFIMISCFNAASDLLLLSIPIPILWTLRIPLYRRIGVFLLLASGIFVLAACITRVSLTVVPHITIRIIARWGARELAIALVAVNTASLRPMFRKNFWLSEKALAKQTRRTRPRNLYVWGSLHRAQQRFNNRQPLQSASAGESTNQNFAAEDGSRSQATFEDPDHQVFSPSTRALQSTIEKRDGFFGSLQSFARSAIETLARGQASVQETRAENERDLEKNETTHMTQSIETTTSAPPDSQAQHDKRSGENT